MRYVKTKTKTKPVDKSCCSGWFQAFYCDREFETFVSFVSCDTVLEENVIVDLVLSYY